MTSLVLSLMTLVSTVALWSCSSSSTFNQNKNATTSSSVKNASEKSSSEVAPVGFKTNAISVSGNDVQNGQTTATGAPNSVEQDTVFTTANEPIPVTAVNLTDYQVNIWQVAPERLEQGASAGLIQATHVTSVVLEKDGSFRVDFSVAEASPLIFETSFLGKASELRLLRRSAVGIPHTLIWYPDNPSVLRPLYRQETAASGHTVTVSDDGSIEISDAIEGVTDPHKGHHDLPPSSNLVLDAGSYRWKDGALSKTCRAYLQHANYKGEGDASYWIDPTGSGTRQSANCDMIGGGFTIVNSLDFLETYDTNLAVDEKIQINGDGFTNLKLVKCSAPMDHLYSDDCSNAAATVAVAIGSRTEMSAPISATRINLTSAVGTEANYLGGENTYASNSGFFQWHYAGSAPTLGTNNMIDAVPCGDVGDSCYENQTATTVGHAITPSGKILLYAANTMNAKLWSERNGDKILRANGLDEWQMTLNPNGKGFSGTFLTDKTVIFGRVCPPNVYIDDSNKFATGMCLYYDKGHPTQTLNVDGSDGIDGLENHATGNGAKWYEGNIKTCNMQGMRLPTLFETNTSITSSQYYPSADGSPVFALTKGVPPPGLSWTASGGASNLIATVYLLWGMSSVAYNTTVGNGGDQVRCVLP